MNSNGLPPLAWMNRSSVSSDIPILPPSCHQVGGLMLCVLMSVSLIATPMSRIVMRVCFGYSTASHCLRRPIGIRSGALWFGEKSLRMAKRHIPETPTTATGFSAMPIGRTPPMPAASLCVGSGMYHGRNFCLRAKRAHLL